LGQEEIIKANGEFGEFKNQNVKYKLLWSFFQTTERGVGRAEMAENESGLKKKCSSLRSLQVESVSSVLRFSGFCFALLC
jgi:hypothetical protein